jgi:hypothetical protein
MGPIANRVMLDFEIAGRDSLTIDRALGRSYEISGIALWRMLRADLAAQRADERVPIDRARVGVDS